MSPEVEETLREIRIVYTTRGIEDGFDPPSLEELAHEYDVNISTLKALHVRQHWDDERRENERYFKETFLSDRKQQLAASSKDLASTLGSIMSDRITFLQAAGAIIDQRLMDVLNNPDIQLKLGDVIKLKELTIKEASSIIDTAIRLKEKLAPPDDTKKGIGAGVENYTEAVRTAFELQKALTGANTELTEEADALFSKLDND